MAKKTQKTGHHAYIFAQNNEWYKWFTVGKKKRTLLLSSPVDLSQATELLNKRPSEKPWSHVCTTHKQLSYTDNQMACVRNILRMFACWVIYKLLK